MVVPTTNRAIVAMNVGDNRCQCPTQSFGFAGYRYELLISKCNARSTLLYIMIQFFYFGDKRIIVRNSARTTLELGLYPRQSGSERRMRISRCDRRKVGENLPE